MDEPERDVLEETRFEHSLWADSSDEEAQRVAAVLADAIAEMERWQSNHAEVVESYNRAIAEIEKGAELLCEGRFLMNQAEGMLDTYMAKWTDAEAQLRQYTEAEPVGWQQRDLQGDSGWTKWRHAKDGPEPPYYTGTPNYETRALIVAPKGDTEEEI